MRDFVIMTDSCCDLTDEMARELGIVVVPLSLEMGGQTYRNWLDGRDIAFQDFYSRIRAGETATTSAVSVGEFEAAIHEGVRQGYGEGYLRKSIVGDPLRRVNTGDNTPAAITLRLVPGDGCRITVAPKGFGSENMSRLGMLKPADGVEGVKKFVVETVRLAGSNPCPPIVLGIGIGGSFDKAAYLAKHALLRPIDQPNSDPFYAQLEEELLEEINALGIGPQGFGGRTTCLGLSIETAPTHVAGLPVAVNVSCHVTRRASSQL